MLGFYKILSVFFPVSMRLYVNYNSVIVFDIEKTNVSIPEMSQFIKEK